MMSACLPETRNEMLGIPEGAILLSSERYAGHGDKTAVNGTDAFWVNGDKVYLNGSEYEVTVSDGKAYVSVNASDAMRSGELYGYYGAYGTPAWNSDTKYLIVGVPSEYTSSYNGGRQVIALPMAAYKPASDDNVDSIKFKHVTAAINVQLMDSLGEDVYVDKVVVTAEKHQLCSPTGITLDLKDDNLGNLLVSTTGGNRSVTVNIPGNACLVTNGTSNKVVQVPIRPIGDGDHLTIEVYCHGATKNYYYKYRPDAAVPALVRNELLTANVKLKLVANGGHVKEVTGQKIDLSTVGYAYTAKDGDTLYGTPQQSGSKFCTVSIEDGATITLNGVTAAGKSLSIRALGDATINLLGTNTITGGSNYAGIHGNSGKILTIQGTGSLYDSIFAYGTAAIGSCYGFTGCKYVINGGYITAIATNSAAAIGCAGSYSCGNITINGGTVIAKTTVNNAAAIGTSQNNSSTCGTITIENTVESVKATKGSGAVSCIGTGVKKSGTQTCGAVTIGGEPKTVRINEYDYNGADANGANNTYTYTPAN